MPAACRHRDRRPSAPIAKPASGRAGSTAGREPWSPSSPLYRTGFQIPLYYGSIECSRTRKSAGRRVGSIITCSLTGRSIRKMAERTAIDIRSLRVRQSDLYGQRTELPCARAGGQRGVQRDRASEYSVVLRLEQQLAAERSLDRLALGQSVELFPTEGLGSTLAQCPPFQGNIRLRYEFAFECTRRLWASRCAAHRAFVFFRHHAGSIRIASAEPRS